MSCVIIFKEELIVIMITIIYTLVILKKTYLFSIKRKYKHLLVFNLRDDKDTLTKRTTPTNNSIYTFTWLYTIGNWKQSGKLWSFVLLRFNCDISVCYVNVFIVMTQHLYSISYFLNKNESNLMFHKYNRYIFNYSFIIQYITIAIK